MQNLAVFQYFRQTMSQCGLKPSTTKFSNYYVNKRFLWYVTSGPEKEAEMSDILTSPPPQCFCMEGWEISQQQKTRTVRLKECCIVTPTSHGLHSSSWFPLRSMCIIWEPLEFPKIYIHFFHVCIKDNFLGIKCNACIIFSK